MKSTEVYATLRRGLDPQMRAAGFTRADAFLSWSRPCGERHLVVWCQVSRDGWDAFAGSKFVVEFQVSPKPLVGGASACRRRLTTLLDDAGRARVREIQNAVISHLPRPPRTHPPLVVSPRTAKWYLAKFELVGDPYTERDDVWFRYAGADDVRRWAEFIAERMPECISAMESIA
jgi:hypothetical protein